MREQNPIRSTVMTAPQKRNKWKRNDKIFYSAAKDMRKASADHVIDTLISTYTKSRRQQQKPTWSALTEQTRVFLLLLYWLGWNPEVDFFSFIVGLRLIADSGGTIEPTLPAAVLPTAFLLNFQSRLWREQDVINAYIYRPAMYTMELRAPTLFINGILNSIFHYIHTQSSGFH